MPRDESEPWPLSDREVALWMLQKAFPEQGVANLGFSFRLPSHVQMPVLQSAVRWLIGRHIPLRSSARIRDQRLIRVLRDPMEITACIEVIQSAPARLDADIRTIAGRPFELEHDEFVRFNVLELPDGSRDLLVVAHHLVLDALSVPSFVSDLAAAYDSFAATGLPPADHAVSRVVAGLPQPAAGSLGYWKDQVAGLRPDAMMLDAGDYANPGASLVGGRYARVLSQPATEALRELRRGMRATENVVLLAAYLLLLHRHGAGDDLVVGIPVDLRPAGHKNVIGYHFSILPLRVRLMAGDSFSSFSSRVFDVFFEALEHRGVSYETIAHHFLHDDYDWQAPFFRHLFNFWPAPSVGPASPGWGGVRQVDTGYSYFDLEMVVGTSDDCYDIQIAYRSDVHDEGFVRRFYDRYEALLTSAAADPERDVDALPIETRHDAVIKRVNRTAVQWPAPHTVPGMVAEQIRAHPGNIAVDSRQGAVSYRELNGMAALIAARLAEAGVTASDVVAVATGRSPLTAAAVLATWRLGAAYLPLDPAHPAERLRFELADAGAAALVGDAANASQLGFPGARVVASDEMLAEALRAAKDAIVPVAAETGWDADANDPAYVIYTSGSTGRPKGVRITHANLANVIRHFARVLNFGPSKAMIWLTTFAFDISALELLMPLSRGGRVVIVDDQTQLNARRLVDLVRDFDVDVLQATPTIWRLISDLGDVDFTGRWLLSGGEPLTAALAKRLLATGARVLNAYGPTETTIWSTAGLVTEQSVGTRPTVGVPIANTTVRVVDGSGEDCQVDVAGEVMIGGDGVAGYLESTDIAASRFVYSGSSERAYRTGDLGLWRPDGRLELLGRKDRQVKVRGQRLELGEVEAMLEEHPAVTAAAAIVDTAHDEHMLTAFVSSRPGLTSEELWNFAALRLPRYAIPSSIQFLETLPVNGSGKIDHHRLSELAAAARPLADSLARPSGAAQEDAAASWLTGVWRDLLDNPSLHADSNFFLSGGESLLALGIVDRVREHYDTDVPLVAIFENPTPRLLGAALNVYLEGRHGV